MLSSIRELIKGCAENAANLMFEETTYDLPFWRWDLQGKLDYIAARRH